ncbi:hypothetical protein LTR22_007580 [Elasticomyces elasticus]|nr:hypothetical protein LTR22_007580 [Elasticomyces elasticus]KAK4928932.1 hypothetical protein LTR49_004433 [Elasticomyces elasticus]KAK5765402.1 hypothetical protein LTS12_004415 [Elasticomyces elasticus]
MAAVASMGSNGNDSSNGFRSELFTPDQTWLCDSQNNPTCWFGDCSHGGTAQCCPALVHYNNASQIQTDQTPQQFHIDAAYDNTSYVSPAQGFKASTSPDSDAWLFDVPAAKVEPVETPPPATAVPTSSTTTKRTAAGDIIRPKSRRLPHNLIERRYRDNLNHQIEVLRNELPNFKSIVACSAGDDIEDQSLGSKWPSKAVVIAAAVQYIASLEQERSQADARNKLLCKQVDGLQKLVKCDDCSIVKYLESMQPRMVSA